MHEITLSLEPHHVAQGWRLFFSNSLNVFDAVVTLAGVADMIVALVPGVTTEMKVRAPPPPSFPPHRGRTHMPVAARCP